MRMPVVLSRLDDPVRRRHVRRMMCTTYKAFAADWIITSGAARDLDQVEALNFPCFSNGPRGELAHGCSTLCRSMSPFPSRCDCATGNLIHADRNGVTP